MRVTVHYEEKLKLNINKVFDLTLQWLESLHKVNIKQSTPPTFIEVKQGTMMTNTGHDPNWKKKIRVNFYKLEGDQTLVRVEAIPLARNIFRVEKLKQSWYDGLFSKLFSLLHNFGTQAKQEVNSQSIIRYCDYCKEEIKKDTKFCPFCGIKLD
jgi:hypothetical protein